MGLTVHICVQIATIPRETIWQTYLIAKLGVQSIGYVKAIVFGFLCGAVVLAVPLTNAHSGRTDSSGCHTCRTNCSKYGLKTGEYHCHGGSRSSASSRSQRPSPPPPPVRLLRKNKRSTEESLPEDSIIIRPSRVAKEGPRVQVEVLTVVDGDTLVAREGETLYLLKLRDLEAPELDQSYGLEARRRLESLAGRSIVVWPEKGEGCVIPVRAETPQGRDISTQLLSEGLAWAFPSAPEDARRLQTSAQLERIGLWRGSKPESPWEYRARRTMAQKPERP